MNILLLAVDVRTKIILEEIKWCLKMKEIDLWTLLVYVCNLICFFLIVGFYLYEPQESIVYILIFLQLVFLLIQFKLQRII